MDDTPLPRLDWAECRTCGTPLVQPTDTSTPLTHLVFQGFCSWECKQIFNFVWKD